MPTTITTSLLHPIFYLTQLYALTYHFYHPSSGSTSPSKERLLIVLAITLGLLSTLTQVQPPTLLNTLSTVSLVASQLLFLWTALTTTPRRFAVIFADVTPRYVTTTGPFAYVRHPTYVSYTLGWLGVTLSVLRGAGLVSWRAGAACVCFAGLCWLYADAAELEERQFVNAGAVGAEYRAYMRRTARWVPGWY